MPVTDLSGDDWLASLIANYGATAPYGASGYPDNLPNMRYGPPGGGLIGYPGATPGAPSMGYPAMGQPPAAPPGPAQGLSLTSNPITSLLAAINPIGSANASVLHPNLSNPNLTNPMNLSPAPPARPSPSPRAPPLPVNALPLAYGSPTIDDYNKWLQAQLMNASPPPPVTRPPVGPLATINPNTDKSPFIDPTATINPNTDRSPFVDQAATINPNTDKSPFVRAASTSTAPPAGRNNRFMMIDRVNAGPIAQPRRGYQTALNLAGLFGRS